MRLKFEGVHRFLTNYYPLTAKLTSSLHSPARSPLLR